MNEIFNALETMNQNDFIDWLHANKDKLFEKEAETTSNAIAFGYNWHEPSTAPLVTLINWMNESPRTIIDVKRKINDIIQLKTK